MRLCCRFIAMLALFGHRVQSFLLQNSVTSTRRSSSLAVQHNVIDGVERILCLSDFHVDHSSNLEWLKEKCSSSGSSNLRETDLVLVAGDVSHSLERLRDSFATLQETKCRVMFVPGNHEAWVASNSTMNSYEKLLSIQDLCREMRVLVDPTLVSNCRHPIWILPLQSWYDASLSIPGCEDLCTDFGIWPWTDFRACKWTHHAPDGTNGKIPAGLADYFHQINQPAVDFVSEQVNKASSQTSVMTMSHFLPNVQCLPDWRDIDSPTFDRSTWFDHGAPGTSSKFAKVAGSVGLEKQIRSIPAHSSIHIFGHSHRPKDFVLDGIRYVHNPLGNPRERLMYMVSPEVGFKEVWNTQTVGQIEAEKDVIRLWEEEGGGLEGLRERAQKHGRGKRLKRHKNSKYII